MGRERNAISRREVLKAAALGLTAVALAACNVEPEPEWPLIYQGDAVDESAGPVHIDRTRIVPPRTQVPPQADNGILPRSAWTSSPLQLKNATPMNGITKITIHHSGDGKAFTPKTAADVARHLQIVQQAHVQRGMVDIGYHFAVDPQGRVWQLRWLEYEGQHVRRSANGTSNNPHNIGIAVLGDFEIQGVPAAQRDRLFELVRLLRSKYALPAATVKMHGEIVDTDCPGKNLKPLIVEARRRGLL